MKEDKRVEYNVNNSVWVKLNEKGYEHLAELHNAYVDIIPHWEIRTSDYYRDQADEDGYTHFQLWRFIELFGSVTRIGTVNYYDTNISLDKTKLQ